MRSITTRSRRRTGVLAALGVVTVLALAGTSPAFAAATEVESGTLTWQAPRSTSPLTLAGYSTGPIGQITIPGVGDGVTPSGSIVASDGATGGPYSGDISASNPAAQLPFGFPAAASATGSIDPVAKTGSINFTGTLTFRAHGIVMLSVTNPTLVFDAPQSVRVVANGLTSDSSTFVTSPYGTGPSRETLFALNGSAATWTDNGGGSWTVSGLAPVSLRADDPATGTDESSYLSLNTAFDGIRPFFETDRPNQSFSVTFTVADEEPNPPVDPPADPPVDPPTGSAKSLDVTGGVDNVLSLTVTDTAADLGTFVPGVAANYSQSVSARATATVPSVLTVYDPAATNRGFLVNGSTPLASPLKVAATNAASPTASYVDLSGTPQTLLSWGSPVSNGALAIRLRQPISSTEGLAAGTYGKTLTFTLSAVTP